MQNFYLKNKKERIKANNKLVIFSAFLFVFTFLISFSSAAIQVGLDGSTNEIGINFDRTPFNISTQSVNSSNYWNTNIGDLDNVNSTQFENSGGQLHLLNSWLTTFINSFGFLTGNIFDQSLNTTDDVKFNNVIVTGNLSVDDTIFYQGRDLFGYMFMMG